MKIEIASLYELNDVIRYKKGGNRSSDCEQYGRIQSILVNVHGAIDRGGQYITYTTHDSESIIESDVLEKIGTYDPMKMEEDMEKTQP